MPCNVNNSGTVVLYCFLPLLVNLSALHTHVLYFAGTLSIRVQDIDDNPPAFSHSRFNARVDENSPSGTPVHLDMQMSLNDPDKVPLDSALFFRRVSRRCVLDCI